MKLNISGSRRPKGKIINKNYHHEDNTFRLQKTTEILW